MDFNVFEYVNISYVIITTLMTYMVLLLLINTTKKWVKVLISTIIGLVVGGLFIHFKIEKLEVLMTSFSISIVLYEWIIKHILNKLNVNVNNEIGIKI